MLSVIIFISLYIAIGHEVVRLGMWMSNNDAFPKKDISFWMNVILFPVTLYFIMAHGVINLFVRNEV